MKTLIKTIPFFVTPHDDAWLSLGDEPIEVHVVSRAVSRVGQTCIMMLVAPAGRPYMTFLNVLHSEKTAGFQMVLSGVLASIPQRLHSQIRLKAALTKPLQATFADAMSGMGMHAPIETLLYPTCEDAPSLGALAKMREKSDLTDALLQDVFRDLERHFFPGKPNAAEPPAQPEAPSAEAIVSSEAEQGGVVEGPILVVQPEESLICRHSLRSKPLRLPRRAILAALPARSSWPGSPPPATHFLQ